MEVCYPLELGLTKEELEIIEREIKDEDNNRLARYTGDDTKYADWKASLEVKKDEEVREYVPIGDYIPTPSRGILEQENIVKEFVKEGYCQIARAVLSQTINDFLQFHPRNPAVAKSKEWKAVAKRHNKEKDVGVKSKYSTYDEDLNVYERAKKFIFGSGAEDYLRESRFEASTYRKTAISRLLHQIETNFEGYAKRSKKHTIVRGRV